MKSEKIIQQKDSFNSYKSVGCGFNAAIFCGSLADVEIPEGITSIGAYNIIIYGKAGSCA